MATGRHNQLTKQAGEYLVAAALCRRGHIATTFTGNVPHYDIVASTEDGCHVVVQVKTIAGSSWQFNITQFADITFEGDRQILGTPKSEPVSDLVCVLVQLNQDRHDKYFVCMWSDLRDIAIRHHRAYLGKHGGVRPRKPKSTHLSLRPDDFSAFEDKWDLIERVLGGDT
jgi:hypothetical protein